MSEAAPVQSTEAPAATPVAAAPAPAPTESAAPAADAPEKKEAAPAKLWSDEPPPAEETKEAAPPEWFMKDKYKTIEDQAKARYDLEKLMGKNWGAPKDDYSLEGIEGITATDPLLEHIKPHLKELGLSQNGFAALMKGYTEAQIAMAKKIEAEVAETLTKSDAMTVQQVDGWLKAAFSEQDRKTIQSWIMSVDDFKVLNMFRLMMPASSSVPSSTNSNQVKFESTKEVNNEKILYRKEVAQGLRVQDKNFEDELQKRWRDAHTRENMGKKK